jgi:hypothetical protein
MFVENASKRKINFAADKPYRASRLPGGGLKNEERWKTFFCASLPTP